MLTYFIYACPRQAIMTPLTLISFILSLAVVDLRYTLMRSHAGPGVWLRRALRRYGHVREDGGSRRRGGEEEEEEGEQERYYHSMQRKLMKMEADAALEMRWVVLGFVGAAVACVGWAGWWLGGFVWRCCSW